jgi:epoxide hydrolase 4
MTENVKVTQLRGLDTAWIERGDAEKPLLLFLHGYPDSPETWDFQIDYFSRRYHVVAPFVRGAGQSEPAKEVARYGRESISLDLLQLLSEVDPSGKKPLVVFGHDLGAVHAWNLAPLLGDRLKGLVILNGLSLAAMSGRLRSLAQHRRSWYIYALQLPWLPEHLIRLFPDGFLDFAHRLGGLPAKSRLRPGQVENCLVHPINQYRAFVREIPAARKQRISRLKAPLMVLWGKEDPFLVTPSAEEWQEAAQNITIRILPAGHWVHRERPDEVNRLIERFLEKLGLEPLKARAA